MSHKTKRMQRQVLALNIFLGIEFLLGVLLTSVVGYDYQHPSSLQTGILVTHIVVGTGIILAGLIWIYIVRKAPKLRTLAIGGLSSVLIAFISGSYATRVHSGAASIIQVVFFIVSFIIYGYSSALLTDPRPSEKTSK